MVCVPTGTIAICLVAARPLTTSRTFDRAVSGDRNVSISSGVAAITDSRYSETNADSPVVCAILFAAFIASENRACVSSHRVGRVLRVNGRDSKATPQFHEPAQHGGFRKFAPERCLDLRRL